MWVDPTRFGVAVEVNNDRVKNGFDYSARLARAYEKDLSRAEVLIPESGLGPNHFLFYPWFDDH